MAKDTSLYVQKKIPTYQEYAQRRAAGETHDQILQQTIQEREAYHQSLPYAYLQGDDWSSYVQQRQARQQRREEVAGQINSYFSVHGPGTNGGSPFARFTPGAQAAARNPAGASGVMDYQELDKKAKIAQAEKRRQQQDKAKRDYEAAVAAYNQAIDRTTAATNEPMDEVWKVRMERAQAEEDAAKQRVDEAKKALDESGVKNGIVQWQGRDALVKEYRDLQRVLGMVDDPTGFMSAAAGLSPEEIKQKRARFEDVSRQLQEIDQATGNGAVDYSGTDRANSILTAAGGGIASSLGKTALTWADYMSKRATDKFLNEDADQEYDYEIPVMQTVRDSYYAPESREKWNKLYAAADSLGESAAADVERAKNGLGRLGQAGVDIAVNVLEMGFDAGVSALTGIPGLAVMGARVFGDSAGEARQSGATLEQQIGYGIAGAGIEVITEKLFDGVAGIYGKGAADRITETVVRRLSSSPTGQSLMRVVIGAINEGNEEVLSDLLHPLAQKIYSNDSLGQLYREIDPADVLYDFLIGAAVGGLYGTAGAVTGGGNAANAENAYLTEMYQQRMEKPGFFREVRDRAILERQAENPAAYETRNMSAEENAQEAMKALRGQQTESQRAQELQQTQKEMASEGMGEMIRAVFSDDGVTLSDGEVKTLTEKAEEGEAGIRETVLGYREAYRMGENGDTWENVVETVGKRYGLTPSQITYAWGYGRNVQTTESGTADISTEEGRTKAESRLAIFGERAQEALELMQPRQDVGRYASALNKAAYLYAANGVDVQQMAEQARSGKAADIVGYLTPEQAALAQRIGEEQRQRTEQSVKDMSAARATMRQQAAALTQGETVTAAALEQMDSALADARVRVQEARKVYADNMEKLDALNRTSAKEWETEAFQTAYNDALDKAGAAKEAIQQTEAEIRELTKKKAEAEGKKIIQRKKGTVSFGGGTVEGRRFEGVERDKLSRQQKKVVAMVESLADTINLDYAFFNGEAGTGGAYVQGGTVFVNVNAGLGVGGFSQTMAAASLSHELTHWLQEYAPEEYQNLKDFVISEVLKAGPQKLNELVKQQRAWEADRNLSYDAALDEVVANACQTMLLDSKAITELARQHMSTAQKIADYISEWTQKVKDAFAEVDTSQGAIYDSLRAVQGGLDRMQKLWDEGIKAASANYDAEQTVASSLNADSTAEAIDASEQAGVQYSRFVEDEDTLAFLNQQEKEGKVVHTYKSFLEIDGKLYPPMASMQKDENGKWKMAHAMEKGRWEESIGDPSKIIIDPKTGKGYFKLKKDNGSDIRAAYNPYQHSSNLMLNDQFSSAYQRPNIVTYECIIPESELTSGYRAEYAKDAVGLHPWKAGIVAGKIAKTKGIERQVYLSRWLKPVRKVSEAEVAQHYKELLDGTDIAVPSNVVTPALLEALEDAGVKIEYTAEAPKKAAQNIGGVKNQYIGENAEDIDHAGLYQAMQLEDEGMSNEDIRQETGWFRGMDGKWRFEIDDSEMKLRDNFRFFAKKQRALGMPLTNFIRHDKLFFNYPEIARVTVSFDIKNGTDTLGGWRGWKNDGRISGHISLNEVLLENGNENELLDTLSHEIQHAIQDWEWFARGSSPDAWERRINAGYDNRTASAKKAQKAAEEELEQYKRKNPEFYENMMALMKDVPKTERGKILDWDTLESEPDSPEWVDFDERRDALEEKYGTEEVFSFMDVYHASREDSGERRTKYDLYRNTAGEIEARDAAARRNMTAEQRRNTPPDLGNEDTVFAEGGAPERKAKFQMIGEVEETPRLVAVHNKSVGGLERMMKRGGVPFPSIAIKKAGTSHEGFGDVSIVFPRETIDPATSKWNKLYSNDAWTPTEPLTEFEVKDASKVRNVVKGLVGDEAWNGLRGSNYLEEKNLERQLDSYQGNLYEALKKYGVVKLAYLKSIGRDVQAPTREKPLDGFRKYSNGALLDVFDSVGGERIKKARFDDQQIKEDIAKALNDNFQRQFADTAKSSRFANKPLYSADDINIGVFQAAYRQLEKDGGKIENEVDTREFERLLENDKKTEESPGYKAWIENTFSGIITDSGIPNGKGIFTDSGNRRSFKARHIPATLDNIVKIMRKENETGIGAMGGINLRGASTKSYKNVEDMRKEAGRLIGTHIADDVYDSYMKKGFDTLHELTSSAQNRSYDDARDILLEGIRESNSKASMDRILKQNAEWIKYTPELTNQLWDLKTYLQNMPAPYFEAKPRRVVYPEEALAYILPDTAPQKLIQTMQGKGFTVMTYKAGDEADRLRKLNSVEGAQFQRWDDTSGDTAAEANGREDAYTRIEAENKAVADMVTALQKLTKKQQSAIDKLQKRLKLTKTPEVRTADANRMARELVKEYGARVDVSGISEQLKELGDYILQAKELDENEVRSRARAIAAEIVDNAVEQVSMEDETISAIAGSIKGRKFTISPDFLGELDQDGGFDAFRKRNFGSFTLAKADSQSIDRSEYISVAQAYADLQSEYGKGYFPDVANEGEEIRNIAATVQAAVPMEVNPFEQYRGEAVEQLANQIAVDSMSGALRPTPPTDADRAKSTRDALKAQIKQLQKEGKIQEREVKDYERTIDELTGELDKAERRYRSLKITGERRLSQVRAEGRARQEEIKAKEREKAAEKIDALKEHYKQMRKDAGERRKNSGTRRKIRKLIDELNRRLKHPTENRHVPRELMQVTIDVLEMIDTGTGRASTKAAEKLADIRAMYERYKNDPIYGMAYDEVTADMLDQLALTVRGKRLMDMNETQLKAVYDTLKSLIHVIDTAVKIKIGTEERNAFELSRSMTQETRGISKAMRGYFREHFIPAHLRADVAFHRFGGFRKNSTWSQVARMLNDGQLAETRLKMELSRPFERIFTDEKALADFTGMNKFGRLDKSKLVDIGLKTESGDAILVTHDMMVSIYLDLLNEDNRRHFINGGKTIPNLQDYYDGKGGWGAGSQRVAGISGRLSELNHQLSEAKGTKYGDWADDIKSQIDALKSEGEQYADEVQAAIERQLTDYDRAWVTAIRQLMDVDSKRELNRTTMEVYGIQKANVPNYWPIFSDSDFLSAPMETVVKDMSLENVGFMKERVKGSNPTLALGSVQVVTRQIDRVAHYCGMMPALRNFGKIWSKTQAGYADSIKNAVHDVFQDSGVQYIENLIADLTGARAEKRDFLGLDALLGKLRGNLAQTTLTLNPRVALAQAASYPTAAAELGWGPLRKALAHGGKDGRIISPADTELIAKWSPLLYLRMQGYSSPELGDIQSSTDLASRVWRKMRWATGWIQAVDGATVGRLWYASEYWVQEHKPTLQNGSDAYYEAVAEKFNAVVEKTQPNYTTMQRAAILRDPSSLVKTFTMFMTQRLQNFNILYDSVASYQVARADFANGRNGVTQEDVREARQTAAQAVTSQLAQAAVYVAFKVIADMLLHNMKKYRDEDTGDFTAKSVSLAILDAYIDALIGVFAFGSELYGIGKALIGVSKWYGLSVSGVDSVNDLIDSVVKLAQSDWTSAEGRAKAKGKLLKVGQNLAQAMGIPLTNGIKLGQAVYYHIKDAIDGRFGSFEAGFERTKKQNMAHEAVAAGIPKGVYLDTVNDANTNGGTLAQDELGEYLTEAIPAGKLTEDQASIIWDIQGWKTDWAKWYEDRAKAAAKAQAITDRISAAGVSQAEYDAIIEDANANGGSLTQDELGEYLVEAISRGEITEEQADAIWKTRWNSAGSNTFDKWRGAESKQTNTTTSAAQENLSEFESFKRSVSLYSDKKEAAYRNWENEVKPLGVSLDSYAQIINAADAAGDGNGSVKQDEMGAQLVQRLNRRELTYEQAEAIWHTFWNSANSKTFDKWRSGKK